MADYAPTKDDRFAFGLWTVMNPGRDAFGEPTRQPISGPEAITQLGRRGVYSFELHAEDLVPADASASERHRVVAEATSRMADADIKCTSIGSDVFSDPVFKDGALTSYDARVRRMAVDRYRRAIEIGAELGCGNCNIWGGREGSEVDAARDPLDALGFLRDAFNGLCDFVLAGGHDVTLSIEPKPNEPRGDAYLPTAGHALGFIATLDHPEMVGVVPEVAHVRMAGLNAYHEIAQVIDAGKLFGVHLNAQKPLRFDQDIRFGGEGLKEAFFIVKAIEDSGWEGARCFDAHAYRTEDEEGVWDFVLGCMRTYLVLREKVRVFSGDPIMTELLGAYRHRDDSAGGGELERPPDRRRLMLERIDQRTIEILLGV